MRRQIAELKGEAARADGEHKGQADPERYLFAVVFASILPPVNIGESQVTSEADGLPRAETRCPNSKWSPCDLAGSAASVHV
jgi:hypothetical protein